MPPDRLLVVPPFQCGEHLHALKALVDVSLDSVEYSGGMTTFESLQAEVPLVHSPGGWKMTQRSAGSVLTAAGLADDLVGKDLKEYEEIAVRLGTERSFYESVLQKLAKSKNESILFCPEIGIASFVSGLRQEILH